MQAPRREGLTNPAPRLIDVRVGSATDGRAPISVLERSLAARPFHWVALAAVALAALLADQTTKAVVVAQLAFGDAVHVVGPLSIHHVRNSGIAFGLFSAWAGVVTLLTAAAVAWMLGYFARSGARHPVLPVALGLLVGGSAGNLADRLRLGHVTDFVDLRYWPAFNLADVFIVTGVAVLLTALVAADREPKSTGPRGRRLPRTSG
ncbi:MAG: signal peptidase II [Thermoleophilia bacterium]|nr:signal peptidase II [Thermoleophilia bacterium]